MRAPLTDNIANPVILDTIIARSSPKPSIIERGADALDDLIR